jgi:hypothetical protein
VEAIRWMKKYSWREELGEVNTSQFLDVLENKIEGGCTTPVIRAREFGIISGK